MESIVWLEYLCTKCGMQGALSRTKSEVRKLCNEEQSCPSCGRSTMVWVERKQTTVTSVEAAI